jgi:hypothetical protein
MASDQVDTPEFHPAMRDLVELFPSITDPEREPRTTAILGCAYLEQCLREAISNKLPELDKNLTKTLFTGTGPLSNVTARLDLVKAMGIIGSNTHHNYVILTQVRNNFAHHFDVHTFDHPNVAELIDKLRPPRLKGGVDVEKARADRFIQMLVLTAGAMAVYLNPEKQAEQTAPPQESA